MVTLFCALVGAEGSAFPVDIDASKSVGHLKNAIRADPEFGFSKSKLQLYLAKKGDAWLPDDDPAAVQLEEGAIHEEIQALIDGEQMKATWSIQESLEDKHMPEPGTREIHVLVVVPKDGAKTMTPVMMTFMEKMFAEIFVKVVPSTVPSKRRSFKEILLNYYGYYDPENQRREIYGFPKKKTAIRCMLTNDFFPASIVIASHLFRHGWKSYSKEAMDLDDIDDPKNGLLLFKPLEKALDEYRISFIYNGSSEKYELKVVDSSWNDKTLISQLDTPQLKELRRYAKNTFKFKTTFGSLEGLPLILRADKLPYNRCLNFQARIARQYALKSGHMKEDEPDFQDFWSDTFKPSETIEWLAQSISDMSVNPELRGEFFDTEEEKDE